MVFVTAIATFLSLLLTVVYLIILSSDLDFAYSGWAVIWFCSLSRQRFFQVLLHDDVLEKPKESQKLK